MQSFLANNLTVLVQGKECDEGSLVAISPYQIVGSH